MKNNDNKSNMATNWCATASQRNEPVLAEFNTVRMPSITCNKTTASGIHLVFLKSLDAGKAAAFHVHPIMRMVIT